MLGIALAIDLDDYEIWDGWILAAIVVWVLLAETGRRFGEASDEARDLVSDPSGTGTAEVRAVLRSRQAELWYVLSTTALLALLYLMIFKPGVG